MTDLAQLFNKYGSNKDRTGLSSVYHILFSHLLEKDAAINILEIGIEAGGKIFDHTLKDFKAGASLRAWRDYFPQGLVMGLNTSEVEISTSDLESEDRIQIYNSSANLLEKFKPEVDPAISWFVDTPKTISLDIIIDNTDNQLNNLKQFYPLLKENGYYILENLDAKFTKMPAVISTYCDQAPLFFTGLKNNVCVIYKKKIESKRFIY